MSAGSCARVARPSPGSRTRPATSCPCSRGRAAALIRLQGESVAGGGGTIRASSGDGTAQFTQGDLNAGLGASVPVTIRFRGSRVVVRVNQGGQEFAAKPSISGGRLVLTPTQGSLPALSIDLPQIVAGITYRKVRLEGDTATLTFTLRKATFKINGS